MDNTAELCLSAIGAFDWYYKTGDNVGAQSVDALASSGGFVFGAEIREKALKTSRDTYKLNNMYTYKGQAYNMNGPFNQFGKGKGSIFNQVGPGVECFNCGGNHYARDCPQLFGKNKGKGKAGGKFGKGKGK